MLIGPCDISLVVGAADVALASQRHIYNAKQMYDRSKNGKLCMKSTPIPYVETAVTTEEFKTTVGASGSPFQYPVTVPAGTRCKKLDGGSNPWAVDDLSFMDRGDAAYHDADHRGIRVPESLLSNVEFCGEQGFEIDQSKRSRHRP